MDAKLRVDWFGVFLRGFIPAAVLIICFLVPLVQGWKTVADIAKRELSTTAKITSFESEDHARSGYSFAANGKTYTGYAEYEVAGQTKIGDHKIVYYDPTNPTRNSLLDYIEQRNKDLILIGAVLIVLSFVFIFGYEMELYYKRRHQFYGRKKQSE